MSLVGALNTFNGTARSIQRDFSGGMFDSLNQMFKDTGGMLTAFSSSCAGILKAAGRCDAAVRKILPKGGAEIEDELRNLDREIGWDARTGSFGGSPVTGSVATSSSRPAASRTMSSHTAMHGSMVAITSPARTSFRGMSRTSPPSSSGKVSSITSSSASSLARSSSSATISVTRTPAGGSLVKASGSASVVSRTSGVSAMAKKYQEALEFFRKVMFPALRYCGIACDRIKEVAKALGEAESKTAELNALLSGKFSVDEFNRRAEAVRKLSSVHHSCCDELAKIAGLEHDFISRFDAPFRQHIADARTDLRTMETTLGRKPMWMQKRISQLNSIEARYKSIMNYITSHVRQNDANVRRLNNVVSELTSRSEALNNAGEAENKRRSSIQTYQKEIVKILQTAVVAHKTVVPKSVLSFSLANSGSRYALTPSKDVIFREEQGYVAMVLKQLEASSARLNVLQKETERLSVADINDTDMFPAFMIADACTFTYGGKNYYIPIPTTFPLSKSRRFSDPSEIAPFLLRQLVAMPVGSVHITIIDHASGGTNGSVFNGLNSAAGIFRLVSRIDDLHSTFKEHGDYISGLTSSGKFGATDRSWSEYNAHHPKNPLPWKILVVYSLKGLDWQDVNELGNLVVNGSPAGVNVLFSDDGISELDDRLRAQVESWIVARNPVDASKWAKEGAALSLRHVPMRMPSNTVVGGICAAYMDCLEKRSARAAHQFEDLFEGVPQWSASSIDGLETVVGWDDAGNPVNIRIGGDNQHGLIGGKTGGGKSNLIHVIICSLCHRYSPEELQICLLDMKDGVEAFRYLDETHGRAWLPHARSILASDSPHFASTFLDEMSRERQARNDLFKRDGANNISSWRRATGRKLPRILVIADEFTRIFADSDCSKESSKKLADLLNLGRSCGIHVLLATQDTDSLVTSNASVILGQTTLRIALPEAKGVLAHGNTGADTLVKPQAIINEFGGADDKNTVFKHPFFNNETRKPMDVEVYRHGVESAVSRIPRTAIPACRIVDGVSLQAVPDRPQFQTLQGPVPVGARPRFNILLGRTDDFNARPFLVPISGDSYTDHLLIVAAKDPEGRPGVWDGLRMSVQTSLGLLPSHQVLFYDPLLEHPRPIVPGITVLGADATEENLREQLAALRDSKAKYRVLVVENFDRANFLTRESDDPFGAVDESSTFGMLSSAFDRKKHAFSVVLFTRDPVMAEEMLGDKGWRCMSHRIAFGFETPTALRSVIKGTEMLDNPGASIYYSSPMTGGGFRTILPFVKGGTV